MMRKVLFTPTLSCVVLVLALALVGCGADEYEPDAVSGKSATRDRQEDLSFQNPEDVAVTEIRLTTSQEFDSPDTEAPAEDGEEDLGSVKIFAVVADQDGNSLLPASGFPFEKYNFSVFVEPKVAPKSLDMDDAQLEIARSSAKVVALVIDSSGSMSSVTETGETRMTVAKEAAALFVDLMGPGDLTGVVDFDDDARIVQELTDDQEALKEAIDGFSAEGATNLGGALTEAVRAVGTRPGKRAAILLTDGDDTVDSVQGGPDVWLTDSTSSRFQGLQLAKENGLVVYTVGLGRDLSETGLGDLQTFADETGGTFFQAPTASDLIVAFGQTIPAEVDALEPLETYLLTVPNLVPKIRGKEITVPLRIGVTYENGIGILRAKFDGTYTVK